MQKVVWRRDCTERTVRSASQKAFLGKISDALLGTQLKDTPTATQWTGSDWKVPVGEKTEINETTFFSEC